MKNAEKWVLWFCMLRERGKRPYSAEHPGDSLAHFEVKYPGHLCKPIDFSHNWR